MFQISLLYVWSLDSYHIYPLLIHVCIHRLHYPLIAPGMPGTPERRCWDTPDSKDSPVSMRKWKSMYDVLGSSSSDVGKKRQGRVTPTEATSSHSGYTTVLVSPTATTPHSTPASPAKSAFQFTMPSTTRRKSVPSPLRFGNNDDCLVILI